MKNITVKLVCAASVIIATGYIPVPSDVPSEGFEYKDFLIRQTRLTCESEILILKKRPDDISGRTEARHSSNDSGRKPLAFALKGYMRKNITLLNRQT